MTQSSRTGSGMRPTNSDPLPRQPKAAVAEILFLGFGFTYVSAAIVYVALAGVSASDVVQWAGNSGKLLLDQIGWTWGIYVAVLLAFYAVIGGEQILGSRMAAARTRRNLGFVAEIMAASTVPALAIVLIYCAEDPMRWSALFVLIPVEGIILFLGVQLGVFVVFEREIRRARARETLAWATSQLAALQDEVGRPVWTVLPANAAAVATVALVPVLLTGTKLALAYWVLLFMAALVQLGINSYTVYDTKISSGWLTKGMSWLLPAFTTGSGVVLGAAVGFQHQFGHGMSVALVPLLALAITIWPWNHPEWRLSEWSIQGAASRLAVTTLQKRRKRALDELAEAAPQEATLPSIRGRLRAVFQSGEAGEPSGGNS